MSLLWCGSRPQGGIASVRVGFSMAWPLCSPVLGGDILADEKPTAAAAAACNDCFDPCQNQTHPARIGRRAAQRASSQETPDDWHIQQKLAFWCRGFCSVSLASHSFKESLPMISAAQNSRARLPLFSSHATQIYSLAAFPTRQAPDVILLTGGAAREQPVEEASSWTCFAGSLMLEASALQFLGMVVRFHI